MATSVAKESVVVFSYWPQISPRETACLHTSRTWFSHTWSKWELNLQSRVCRMKSEGPVTWSDAHPPGMRTVAGSIIGCGNILLWRLIMKSFLRPFSPYHRFKQGSYWRKDVHLVLVNYLGSLPRNSVTIVVD